MTTSPFLSICIPSYNRPNQLLKLLNSIYVEDYREIEIIICEDNSPRRNDIISAVNSFNEKTKITCKLYLNVINLGYDENLKELIKKANGEYIMYMGDDDVFQEGSLVKYVKFLKKNSHLGYILRRYTVRHNNGINEEFIYYNSDQYFEPGINAFNSLFRKSVFISGFCFKRSYVLSFYETSYFKGTLLYQLFLCAKLVLTYPSAYCNIPLTIMDENERGVPEFGSSINESNKYTPGKISVQNSINFIKSFLIITRHIDSEFGFNSTSIFLKDLSKYSYPVLSIQRDNGFQRFIEYNRQLKKEVNINNSIYYYIYFYSLIFLGKKNCDSIIIKIKKIFGKTPNL